ncbi:hypothetical protein [Amycolatopsis sp. cmx-4-54]|uniref:hypothetical protein n=1 Tax=Amycolatopsis sp. cmx-4-54 TaxID=2790936 RepID=UPI00397878BF
MSEQNPETIPSGWDLRVNRTHAGKPSEWVIGAEHDGIGYAAEATIAATSAEPGPDIANWAAETLGVVEVVFVKTSDPEVWLIEIVY